MEQLSKERVNSPAGLQYTAAALTQCHECTVVNKCAVAIVARLQSLRRCNPYPVALGAEGDSEFGAHAPSEAWSGSLGPLATARSQPSGPDPDTQHIKTT